MTAAVWLLLRVTAVTAGEGIAIRIKRSIRSPKALRESIEHVATTIVELVVLVLHNALGDPCRPLTRMVQ